MCKWKILNVRVWHWRHKGSIVKENSPRNGKLWYFRTHWCGANWSLGILGIFYSINLFCTYILCTDKIKQLERFYFTRQEQWKFTFFWTVNNVAKLIMYIVMLITIQNIGNFTPSEDTYQRTNIIEQHNFILVVSTYTIESNFQS